MCVLRKPRSGCREGFVIVFDSEPDGVLGCSQRYQVQVHPSGLANGNGGAGGDDVLRSCQAIVALSICGMTFRWSSTSCLGV